MARQQFDVVIIGGGNAGMGVTTPTRNAGLLVALLEPDMMGAPGLNGRTFWHRPRDGGRGTSGPGSRL